MKLVKILPKEGGYLKRTTLVYENEAGKKKHYEIMGRREVKKLFDLEGYIAGVMVVITNDKNQVLVCEEFRCGVNKKLLGFPTGMVGFGETPSEAAVRETYEETGVEIAIDSVTEPLFINPAMSVEKMVIAFGHVVGNENPRKSDNVNEEITSAWKDIEELKTLSTLENKMSLASRLLFEIVYQKYLIGKKSENI